MLRFLKGQEPRKLAALRASGATSWDEVDGDTKAQLRERCCADQGNLCAYCQRRIRHDAREGGVPVTKIEHYVPRSTGEGHLAWSNLLAVCSGVTDETRHCDRSRGDDPLFLHPVDGRGPDPRQFLRYLGDGSVVSDDARATADVALLNLNAGTLPSNRARAIDALRVRLTRSGWSAGALASALDDLEARFAAGEAPEYVEVARYHLRRWLRRTAGRA